MSDFQMEFVHHAPSVEGYAWDRKLKVTGDTSFYISTSPGRCCGFNMMEGVSRTLWHIDYADYALHTDLKLFLRGLKEDDKRLEWFPHYEKRPRFRIGQLFWTQDSRCDDNVHPAFVKQFDWQSASEPDHRTSMFMYSFGDV